MALLVAMGVADGQIFLVTRSAGTARLNMLQRGVLYRHVLATHPARHLAMQLHCDSFINSNSGISKTAHAHTVRQALKCVKLLPFRRHGRPRPSTLA